MHMSVGYPFSMNINPITQLESNLEGTEMPYILLNLVKISNWIGDKDLLSAAAEVKA